MLDANIHGAGDNPEFMKKWTELRTKTDRLRASMRAAGLNTEEYDRQIKQDVSDFLKAKGLSDQQIKDALAKNENPLDAVQPYLDSDKDSQGLANRIRGANTSENAGHSTDTKAQDSDKPLNIDTDAMNARLAAAGLGANSTDNVTGHGLGIQKSRSNVIEH